jgi:hypothetical protein
MQPRVKVGGRYRMDDGHVVVDSIVPIELSDVTHDLARESGFGSVEELLQIAKHGRGENVYLVRFHYLPPGGWDVRPPPSRPPLGSRVSERSTPQTKPKRR